MVIIPLTFCSARCYFMKSGSERCYSGHARGKTFCRKLKNFGENLGQEVL